MRRGNTGDNTPAAIYTEHRPGGRPAENHRRPKGFGSENMSQIRMLKPADGVEGVKDFVLSEVVRPQAQPLPADRGGRGHRRHL